MKLSLRAVGAAVAAVSVSAGLLVAMSGPAGAVTPLPHDPSYELGTVSFYDASGNRVTSGDVNATPFATYAVASSDDPITTNTKATLYGYLPVNGTAPGAWSGEALSASTTFPVASAPGSVASAGPHQPVVTQTANDLTLAQLMTDFPNNATDSYQGMYQLRVKTAGNSKWWSADIQVTGTTWTQVYPVVNPTATSTSLATTPAQAYVGQAVTLTATVSPSAAAGTVQFTDGGTALGAPVAVSNGQAQLQTTALTEGSHTLAAAFTPTDPTGYAASTSSNVTYTVLGAPAWRPVLYGAHRVGMTDSCLAAFTNSPSLSYTWSVNGTVVSGATAATYLLPETAYGKSVSCSVTATNPAGTQSAGSVAATVGIGPALVPTTKPYLFGYHTAGKYEYVNVGAWKPAATLYTYQWYLGTTKVSGATAKYYKVPAGKVGQYLYCVVTAKRAAWTNGVFRTAGVKIT